MVSLLLETSNIENTLEANEKFESPLIERLALLKETKSIRFNEKQTNFSLDKFEEGIRASIRWKSEALAQKMQELKSMESFTLKPLRFLLLHKLDLFSLHREPNVREPKLMKMTLEMRMKNSYKII